MVLRNVEGVPDHFGSDFTSISRFMVDDDHYLAYINGKSAGRVGKAVASGPHRFTGEEWEVPLESSQRDLVGDFLR